MQLAAVLLQSGVSVQHASATVGRVIPAGATYAVGVVESAEEAGSSLT